MISYRDISNNLNLRHFYINQFKVYETLSSNSFNLIYALSVKKEKQSLIFSDILNQFDVETLLYLMYLRNGQY